MWIQVTQLTNSSARFTHQVSTEIAIAVAEYVYTHNEASHYPEPEDKRQFILDQMYSTDYDSFVPDMYEWPGM